MIKTRIDYKGNNLIVRMTRRGDVLRADVIKTNKFLVVRLEADVENPNEMYRLASTAWSYLEGRLGVDNDFQHLINELQQIGQSDE